MASLKSKIIDVPDWPKKGVIFRDITPLLADRVAFLDVIDDLTNPFWGEGISKVVGIEARGFLLAAPLAYTLDAGLVIVRKRGKLPRETVSGKYALEYGEDILEMHRDAIQPEERVLIVDDVLATGGTAKAAVDLVKQLGGVVVGLSFLIELLNLNGRDQLKDHKIFSLISY